jgi:hypothetical protein
MSWEAQRHWLVRTDSTKREAHIRMSMNANPSRVCTACITARTASFARMNGGVTRARARSVGGRVPGRAGSVTIADVGSGLTSGRGESEAEPSLDEEDADAVGRRFVSAFSRLARAICALDEIFSVKQEKRCDRLTCEPRCVQRGRGKRRAIVRRRRGGRGRCMLRP